MAITSFETADAVRRLRKISRSSVRPISGASTKTERMSAGTMPHSQSCRALKNMAAEM